MPNPITAKNSARPSLSSLYLVSAPVLSRCQHGISRGLNSYEMAMVVAGMVWNTSGGDSRPVWLKTGAWNR